MTDRATIERILGLAERFDGEPTEGDWRVPCAQCGGKGHHGLGEDGRDPNWCGACGGDGMIIDDQKYHADRIAWIAARLEDGG